MVFVLKVSLQPDMQCTILSTGYLHCCFITHISTVHLVILQGVNFMDPSDLLFSLFAVFIKAV